MDRRRFMREGTFGLAGMGMSGRLLAGAAGPSLSEQKLIALQDTPLQRFAFGSCNYSDLDQSYWHVIARDAPDLWIWLGDNIYGDFLSMAHRKARYRDLKKNPHYAAFRSVTPVIGTWDDHDFAANNMDGRFYDKWESKLAFMDFMDIGADSPVANRNGIYQSYTYGPVGQRTKVVMLDLRFNQDKSRNVRVLLGEEQWRWFEGEVLSDDFELLIIGSSLNVTSPAIGFGLEGWRNFGRERQQLYSLLTQVSCPTLILSGDRHQAEIARVDPGNGRPLYEFMSSGLTHSTSGSMSHPGRIGPLISERNYGWVTIDWSGLQPVLQLTARSPKDGKFLNSVLA